MLRRSEAIPRLNALGGDRIPFAFYCDFQGERWCIETEESEPSFLYHFRDHGHSAAIKRSTDTSRRTVLEKHPLSFEDYHAAFREVIAEIQFGNSFLTNLTFKTPIETEFGLEDIFYAAEARYKLCVPDRFVVFSPETFVKIREGKIYSYPMKGTINAAVPDAERKLLDDPKEQAEHVTIVDLIRNDLSRIASNVEVSRFRYLDKVIANDKELLQVSSEITGTLGQDWNEQLGTLLCSLLPAGSISGAPKTRTVRIIEKVETYERGFYTGICGRFDGHSLDTGVMIRFIKQEGDRLYYCSGGGITSFSEAEKEYQEMIDKIYLPIP